MLNSNELKERKQAWIDSMVLAAVADGEVTEREIQTVIRRVIERPEFEGTRPEALKSMVEQGVKALASSKSLESILKSLRERLPDHSSRLLAFGLASAVVLGDHRATKEELGLLKTFQAALGIAETEVAQVIDIIEQGGSLSQALGEPAEKLYAEVMVLMSVADGTLKETEARALVENLSADPVFGDVTSEHAQQLVSEAVAALATFGLPSRLGALAQGLSTHSQRKQAFRLAFRIANASGNISSGEARILNLLQATFGLADDEVEQLRKE